MAKMHTQLPPPGRGTGKTTEQIRNAPPGAFYVWCSGATHYPQSLSRTLGRHDLTIVSSSWLRPNNVYSRRIQVVIDHAFWELRYDPRDAQQSMALGYLRAHSLLS